MVWNDEFQGSSLDTSKWVYWLYPGSYKDATLAQNSVSEGGDHVVITTYTSSGTHFTAMISTQGKFHARYGYFEANIQWADNTGMWSAFWLQSPTMGSYIGDPSTAGAEIDVCEHRLQDGSANNINNQVQANIHWNGYGSSAASAGSGNFSNNAGNLGSGFHKYGLLWDTSSYTIYTEDGQQKWSTSSGHSDRTEFMILSSIVDDTDTTWAGTIPSGGYGSLGSSSTKLAVDYVRYYAPTNTLFWTGFSSAYWTNSANWVASMVPGNGNDIVFSMLSIGNFSTALGQDTTVNSISIQETSPITINGNTLTINGGGIDMVSAYNDATINSDVAFGNGNHWKIGSGRTLRVVGHLSGGHSLSLDGYGTAALYNNNSYSLGTFVNRGTLRLVNGGGLGATAVGTTVSSGGQVQIYTNLTCNQPITLNGSGPSSDGALRVSASASANWAGAISLGSAATINLDGGTSLSLAGGVNLSSQTLTLSGDPGSLGTVASGIVGSGSLGKGGAGTWLLSTPSSFTGPVSVSGGILRINNNGGYGAGPKTVTSATRTGGLELDGGVTIPSNIQFLLSNDGSVANGATVLYALRSVTGVNTILGPIRMTSGGGFPVVTVDAGGSLNLNGAITNDTARTLILQGGGAGFVNAPIQDGLGVSSLLVAGGNWTLNATNTYSGGTTNIGGTLALGPGSSLVSPAIVVSSGATFDVSAVGGFALNAGQLLAGSGVVTGNVTAASGSLIGPGFSPGTLSFSNNLTLSGGETNLLDLSNTTAEGSGVNDEIIVAGNLNLAGTNTLLLTPISGALANGRYALIRYQGARTGGATNLAVAFSGFAPIASITVDDSITNEIDLVVFANPANLVWQGDGSANSWDIATSSNWFNGVARSAFSPGDIVTCDDTATNRTVNVNASVAPGALSVVGTGSYTFSGSGKITGASGIVKSNAGSLILTTTNNYSGPTTIGAGTLQVGNGTLSGALGTGSVIDNGVLAVNNPDTISIESTISGSGSLTKTGSGSVNIGGNNSFAGGTLLTGGSINVSNNAALGTGPIVITNGGVQLTVPTGSTLANAVTIGGPSGLFASGVLKGPASGSATFSGPITVSAASTNGGAFDGGNTSGGLIFSGPITAPTGVMVRHRSNRAVFSGGGSYTAFWNDANTVLGATNGLATSAVATLGFSGAAGSLDLAGFSQTLNGLQKGTQTATVGNSSTTSDSVLTISGITSNTTYAGVIQDSLSGGTRKVFLNVAAGTFTLGGANTFSGDTHINAGTLVLTNSSALLNSPLNLDPADYGVLSFGPLTAATVGGLEGTRDLALTNASGAAVALTVGNNNTSTYIYYGGLSGSGSLTKISAGTLILSGDNTFTGVINVDTGQPSTGNDGALRIASPISIGNPSNIAIRNQNLATSTLQLDGTAGGITISQPVIWNGRNNFIPAVESLAGNNVWSPPSLTLGVGGSAYPFQADADTLTISTAFPALGAVGTSSSAARNFVFQGSGNIAVGAVIRNANPTNGLVSLIKTGAGMLTLSATNTYTGGTTNQAGTLLVNGVIGPTTVLISGGTFGGTGTIAAPVIVQAGGTLAPGNSGIGTLTISNSLSLAGTTSMELDAAAGVSDLVRGMTSVTYGGTLNLIIANGVLTSTNTFKLFSANTYGGVFSVLQPALPGPGLAWNTNTLATDGTLRILSTVNTTPTNMMATVSGSTLALSWPTDHTGWRLQSQTNSSSDGLGTNWSDVAGSTATNQVVITMDASNGSVFFRMVFP